MDKYAMIVNPYAGRGRSGKLSDFVFNEFKNRIGEVSRYVSEYPGHAKQIAREIKNDFSVIVAVGGDGTVHEVVNGMIGGKATLGVIPIGSGNDFVKMLNLPSDPRAAIEVVQRDRRKKVDVGKVQSTYFPNGLGIGFDAWVVRESQKVKRLRGLLIYVYAVLKTVFSYKNQKITFSANGKTETKEIFLIAIGNGTAMGGGFYLNPDALIDDGEFDICIIHALKKREVFFHLPKVFWGKHIFMHQVEMLRTNSLCVKSEEGIAVHADGELLGMDLKELEISMHPAALEVIYKPGS